MPLRNSVHGKTMKLAIDVQYEEDNATVAGVLFNNWQDKKENNIFITQYANVEDYVSGQFYRREMPCILKLLSDHNLTPDTIIIDGFVTLSENKKGLGKYLFEALSNTTPIIGVAKNSFSGISKNTEIIRGKSIKPLYVTSAGIELEEAKALILSMHGEYRIPTLLKLADAECRNN